MTIESAEEDNLLPLNPNFFGDSVGSMKNRELYICCINGDQSEALEKVAVVRYLGVKKIKVYNYEKGPRYLGRCCPTIVKNTGKNKFYVTSDTPFSCNSFGCYHARIPMKLQGNRLVCVNAGIYDLKVPNSQIGKYTLARSMTLYFPPSCSKPIGTLPSGTSFTATKIMVADVEAVYDTVEVR